jgi:Ca-activated chloride channel family protein
VRTALAAWLAVLSFTAAAQQPFRVSVDAVRVDVQVLDGNRPVGGLTPADFELWDSGVPQRIDSIMFEDVPLSVMLALDASGSVRGAPLEHLKQAAAAVTGLLRPGDRAALLTFAEEIDLSCDWTADRGQLERAIAGTEAAGSTALHDASFAALTLKDAQVGRALILVFSDGDDNNSWLSGQTVMEVARRNDAVIYGVGLRTTTAPRLGYLVDFRSGLQPDVPAVLPPLLVTPFLTALAEETGGKYLEAERSDRLRDVFVRIITEFRSRYLLTYTPTGVERGGWHPIQVKLKNTRGNITARRGYLR